MSCGEPCGWLAAVGSMLAFGSFGVPIKSDAAKSVDIDPLVFQSYKTFMCFATSWLVLWGSGEEFSFTPWGIVSGLFWVPGGVATVYAIKVAGLAIGIGVGSSFIVLVSFVWGIFVFEERVHSKFAACMAILSMMIGLLGMSYYSAPVKGYQGVADQEEPIVLVVESHEEVTAMTLSHSHDEKDNSEENNNDERHNNLNTQPTRSLFSETGESAVEQESPASEREHHHSDDDDNRPVILQRDDITSDENPQRMITVCGRKLPERHVGMMAAAFCGIWGGSILVPMKWCQSDTKGTHYLMSFSIGASIVTVSLWILRYLYMVIFLHRGDARAAYQALPSFHLKVMWRPGAMSGLLWSIGNFFSLISVNLLGEGVGYPLVQTSILVSGLWGIFYFQEVVGYERISKWLASSLMTIFGILLLSYEHHEK